MHRISSNWTLFLKIFLPIFWTVFFGLFALAANLEEAIPRGLKTGSAVFFLAGSVLFWCTLVRLKRVEVDEGHVFASNYFKTYRYPFGSIERIWEHDAGLFTIVRIWLKSPGKFGRKITFLLDGAMWKAFLEKHPAAAAQLAGLKIEEKK